MDNIWEQRGKRVSNRHDYMLVLVDDALAGLDCGLPNVTRERLESLWKALQSIKEGSLVRPQSDYVRSLQAKTE